MRSKQAAGGAERSGAMRTVSTRRLQCLVQMERCGVCSQRIYASADNNNQMNEWRSDIVRNLDGDWLSCKVDLDVHLQEASRGPMREGDAFIVGRDSEIARRVQRRRNCGNQ